ncbi:hypothetical protein [Anaeroselena agilis]|uniref:Uncharacterized protein n=1 Tax=Anaeroselena agilis TaxID=3063788 RepID=A0ABU3NYW5_9FIRM|nr:hypothetical protein [Selenomonadales bacterium 4137-cl]
MRGAATRLAAAVAVCAALLAGPSPAAAEYQLVGFISQHHVYMDTDSLQYCIDPQGNRPYYDVWTKNVYSEEGREEMIRKVKALGYYSPEWEELRYSLVHKYFRLDKASYKIVGVVAMTKDDRILELGEAPPERIPWEAIVPKTVDDDIYKRIKLYEAAYQETMVERSLRDRYKVIGNNIRMTASVDTANARFFRDPYSGKVYAEVWLRLDLSGEEAAAMRAARKEQGRPLRGWEHLGYIIDKGYYDFAQNRMQHYGMYSYTRQGALLERLEDKEENRTDWQQPIPESWGEYLFVQVKKFMTGE